MNRRDGRPLWVSSGCGRCSVDGSIQAVHSISVDITIESSLSGTSSPPSAEPLPPRRAQTVHNFEEIVGRSPAMLTVLDMVGRVAPTDATVLVVGETGTGKELMARAIHSNTARAAKPLIKVNCAALPTGLVESELFGHEKGAFTGAIARHIGRFELADGGTLFLDEVGELPLETQSKLLHVLQEHEFDRVGGTSPRKVDVRVIAATNRELKKAVHEKTFREDLYYRLSVFPIQLPPLRERSEDIPLLAQYLLNKFAAKIARRIQRIDPATLKRLMAYQWPATSASCKTSSSGLSSSRRDLPSRSIRMSSPHPGRKILAFGLPPWKMLS